jgi:chitin synthase
VPLAPSPPQAFEENRDVYYRSSPFFFIENIFMTINMIFSWFAIGNFFLVFKILTTSLGADDLLGRTGEILGVVFTWLYGVFFVSCFVLSMGIRPAGSGRLYTAMVWFWAIIMM